MKEKPTSLEAPSPFFLKEFSSFKKKKKERKKERKKEKPKE
jgi:hypothetical protein